MKRSTTAMPLMISLLGMAPDAGGAFAGDAGSLRVYVGTYTRGESQGIYLLQFDTRTGELRGKKLAAKTEDPSFLAIHPDGKHLYAVNEIGQFQGEPGGAVSAFEILPSGELKPLNQQPSRGAAPCHLVVDRTGRNVLVANYTGGSVAVLPIEPSGRLGEPSDFVQHEGKSVNPRRQEAPHAHSIHLDAAGRFAFAADLGLDKVLVYRFDPDAGKLRPHEPASASVASGSGPRHFDFHPGGRFAYVINELLSTVTAFAYDAEAGRLESIQTISTLPEGFEGDNSTAEVRVHPSGKFLYGSNRGHDSIAMFAIDPSTGNLQPLGHEPTGGKTPRNFNLTPDGAWLLAANQNSDTLVVFRVDPQSGRLQPTGQRAEVPNPVCVRFLSAALR